MRLVWSFPEDALGLAAGAAGPRSCPEKIPRQPLERQQGDATGAAGLRTLPALSSPWPERCKLSHAPALAGMLAGGAVGSEAFGELFLCPDRCAAAAEGLRPLPAPASVTGSEGNPGRQ